MPLQWLVIKKCEKIAYKEKMCTSIETGRNQMGSFHRIISMLSWKKLSLIILKRKIHFCISLLSLKILNVLCTIIIKHLLMLFLK